MQHVALEQSVTRILFSAQMVVAFLCLALQLCLSLLVRLFSGHLFLVNGAFGPLFGQFCEERLHWFKVGFGVQEGKQWFIDCFIETLSYGCSFGHGSLENAIQFMVGGIRQVVKTLVVEVLLETQIIAGRLILHGSCMRITLSESMGKGIVERHVIQRTILLLRFLNERWGTLRRWAWF